MMFKIKYKIFLSIVILIYLSGCEKPLNHRSAIQSLEKDVGYLASDSLEGRETGTNGAKLASTYLAERFHELGLEPKGTDGYFQELSF